MNCVITELSNENELTDFRKILSLTPRQARDNQDEFLDECKSKKFYNMILYDGLLNVWFDVIDFSKSRKYKNLFLV